MTRKKILIIAGPNGAGKTTLLSGVTYARRIPRWQAAGYHVTLFFLRLSTSPLKIL